jgi:hypothetical protein
VFVRSALLRSVGNMYLEIVPRQVGKSTRLAAAVKKHLETTDDAVFVLAHSGGMASHLKKLIGETCRPYIITCSWYYVKFPIPSDKLKLFVDEFDFLEKHMKSALLQPQFREVLKNGYFTTTPCSVRSHDQLHRRNTSDLLVKLVQLNNHNYTMFINHRSFAKLSRAAEGFSPERRRNELFGAFSD